MSKRVVIIIVEGDSDEELLINRLRDIYKNSEIRFEPQNGDIFYDKNSQKSIKALIGDVALSVIKKRKYKPSDILAILHIMDTDGCFIDDDKIIIDSSQRKQTLYTLKSINVIDNKQKNRIVERNQKRSQNIRGINCISSIVNNRFNYQLYYFSRNLEHVIFNESNPEDELKSDKIEEFVNNLNEPIEQYLLKYMPDSSKTDYRDKFKQSWSFIEQDTNSLQRFTNVPLLITFLNEIV